MLNFLNNGISFNVASKCSALPQISNGQTIGSIKDYYGKTVTYRCDPQFSFTDGSSIKSTTCYPNENGTLYWRGYNNFTCEKSKCLASSEFSIPGLTNLNPILLTYELETTVKYSCPNGLQRKAVCRYNQMLSKASWEYEGKCVGKLSVYISEVSLKLLAYFVSSSYSTYSSYSPYLILRLFLNIHSIKFMLDICPYSNNQIWTYNSENGKCYSSVYSSTKSWEDASAKCNQDGGSLVVIQNKTEQTFIQNKVSGISNNSNYIWLGGKFYEGKKKYYFFYSYINP